MQASEWRQVRRRAYDVPYGFNDYFWTTRSKILSCTERAHVYMTAFWLIRMGKRNNETQALLGGDGVWWIEIEYLSFSRLERQMNSKRIIMDVMGIEPMTFHKRIR